APAADRTPPSPNTTPKPPRTCWTRPAGETSTPHPSAPTAPHTKKRHDNHRRATSPRHQTRTHTQNTRRRPPRPPHTRQLSHLPPLPQLRLMRKRVMTTTAAPPAAVTKPGLIHIMPDAAYHADPVPAGSLSSTGARFLLDSPARYHHELNNRQGRRAFDIGHVIHTKILGTGAPIATHPDEHLTPSGNPSTKAATRAWEDEQRANGLAIISRADLALVEAMSEAVLAHQGARELLEKPGHSEVSAFAPDPDTGVWCRAR